MHKQNLYKNTLVFKLQQVNRSTSERQLVYFSQIIGISNVMKYFYKALSNQNFVCIICNKINIHTFYIL